MLYAFFLPQALNDLVRIYEKCATRLGDSLRVPRLALVIIYFVNHAVSVLAGRPGPNGISIPDEVVFLTIPISIIILAVIQREVNRINRLYQPMIGKEQSDDHA